jgi:hypothetical protein
MGCFHSIEFREIEEGFKTPEDTILVIDPETILFRGKTYAWKKMDPDEKKLICPITPIGKSQQNQNEH